MREYSKEVVSILSSVIGVLIVSLMLYVITNSPGMILGLDLLIGVILILNYRLRYNVKLWSIYFISSGLICYLFKSKIANYYDLSVQKITENIIFDLELTIIIVFLVISLIMILYSSYKSLKSKTSIKEEYKLFEERKLDLEEIKSYLDKFQVVGLNGEWGTGKSYLVKNLKNDLSNRYNFIHINTLMFSFDEIQIVLMNEIELLLNENGIFSTYSAKLKKYLNFDSLNLNVNSLIGSNSDLYHSKINGLKGELNKLKKSVIVIIEDIDRIDDDITKIKILDLIEQLASGGIKFLIEYNESHLVNENLSYRFLEKYLPFKVNMSLIPFHKMVNYILSNTEESFENIDEKMFDIFKYYIFELRFSYIEDKLGIKFKISNLEFQMSVRMVERYLDELNINIDTEMSDIQIEVTTCIYYIKHFYPRIFSSLEPESEILDQLKFIEDANEYTVKEIIEMIENKVLDTERFKNLMSTKENRDIYIVLKILNYELDYFGKDDLNFEKQHEYMSIPFQQIDKENIIEKRSRIIRKAIAKSKSTLTNYEYVGKMLCEVILNNKKENWDTSYSDLMHKCFHLSSNTLDQNTVFRLGGGTYIELAKALMIIGAKDSILLKYVYFLVEMNKSKGLTHEVICAMNYLTFVNGKNFISTIREIIKLDILGNMNNENYFSEFIKKYVRYIFSYGYYEGEYRYNVIDFEPNKVSVDSFLNKLSQFKETIINKSKKFEKMKFLEISEDLSDIYSFLDYIEKLIRFDKKYEYKEWPQISTKINSVFINQKSIDEVQGAQNSEEKFELIQRKYAEGNLSVVEIESLMEKNPI